MMKILQDGGRLPKAIHMFCNAHKLHNFANKLMKGRKMLNNTMLEAKNLFTKATSRRRFFAEGNYPVPPKYAPTRWGSCIIATDYYADANNLIRLKQGILLLKQQERDQKVNEIMKCFNIPSIL